MATKVNENISVIYLISSKTGNKRYIGSAIKYAQRISQHLYSLKNNNHPNRILQSHVNKYGIDDIVFSIVEKVMFKEDLIKREQYYIDTLQPEFNICKIAGSNLGRKFPKQGELNRILKTGVKQSEEHIRKRTEAIRGKKRSKEFCNFISALQKGRKKPPISDETRKKLSAARIGVRPTAEQLQKRSDRVVSIPVFCTETGLVYKTIADAIRHVFGMDGSCKQDGFASLTGRISANCHEKVKSVRNHHFCFADTIMYNNEQQQVIPQ